MAQMDEAPILELGRNPIPGPSATGTDAADDPDYIFVMGELGKMDRIDVGEPDWYQLGETSSNLLRSKSKDAELASSLGLSLFKRYRYAGLAASLGMIIEMVNTFWDGMFPDRPRRRKARIESMAERFTDGGWFRENAPQPDDFDAIDLCVTRIADLDTALKARMPDDPPDFAKFTRVLKELAAQRPRQAEAAAPPGGAPPSAGAAPVGGGATFTGGEVADKSGAENAILAAATFLRKADATDPIPYAVVRAVKWGAISLPSSDAARNQIEPPEASKVDALTHQLVNSLWENLLKNAEAAFRSSDPLWLDLQRYTCAAMTGLGPTYEKARLAVVAATAGLVRRLGEGLYDLHFRGGMPLCSGETRLWIEAEVAPAPKGGGPVGDGRLIEATEKARELAASGNLKEALAELHTGLQACPQKRDRLLWRLEMAKFCADAQRFHLAGPILEECAAEIREHRIDEWEPSLAAEVAGRLYRCRKAAVSLEKDLSPELQRSLREAYAWLCKLDAMVAFSVDPPGK